MNKCLNFNFCKYQKEVAENLVDLVIEDPKVEVKDPMQPMYKIIYSLGVDGYPVGELAYYVGKSANPDVQRFILENLLMDVSANANPSSMNLSDDQITLFTRRSDESLSSYVTRLNESIQKDSYLIDAAQRSVQEHQVQNQPAE